MVEEKVAWEVEASGDESDDSKEVIGCESSEDSDQDIVEIDGEDTQLNDDDFVEDHVTDENQEQLWKEMSTRETIEHDVAVREIVEQGVEDEGVADEGVEDEDLTIELPLDDDAGYYKEYESDEGQKKKRIFPRFNDLIDLDKPIELKSGMIFKSNDVLRAALRKFSVDCNRDYYYLHNDKQRVTVYCKNKCDCPMYHGRKHCTCKESKCGFYAYASKLADDGSFQLKSLNAKHDCWAEDKNTKLLSDWLADKYLENWRDDSGWKLTAFMEDVRRKYGYQISYSQAWKSRYRAMLKCHGDSREDYARVWDYAATIRERIEGSSTFVKVDLTDPTKPSFQRIYIAFAACIKGFKEGCRPILGVDGCHLRGAYTGQVLVAVGKDPNNNCFLIAFAVVEAERKETWAWFLEKLLEDIGEVQPTIMSDRQKGLVQVLANHVASHKIRVCVRHLYNNFKSYWPGSALKDMVWAAARAYTASDFAKAMDEIKKCDDKAFNYLLKQEPKTWSRHLFQPNTKSDMLLNNVCETFNSFILPARDKPVIGLCEWIRRQLVKRFDSKRRMIARYDGTFTPNATKLIEASKQEAFKHCRSIFGGGSSYEVDHHGKTYIVDLDKRTCDCFKWELTGIPCPHAICCIQRQRGVIDDFVDPCYRKEMYMKAYNHTFNTMPGFQNYVKTGKVPPEPPKTIVQPGRPKKHARRRGEGEEPPSKVRKTSKRVRVDGFNVKCSKCQQPGHNKRSCKNAANENTLSVKTSYQTRGRPKNSKTVVIGSQKRTNTKKKLPRPAYEPVMNATVENGEVSALLPSQDSSIGTNMSKIINL